MITLDNQDVVVIYRILADLKAEDRKESRRSNRVYNLCNKISLVLKKAERRTFIV